MDDGSFIEMKTVASDPDLMAYYPQKTRKQGGSIRSGDIQPVSDRVWDALDLAELDEPTTDTRQTTVLLVGIQQRGVPETPTGRNDKVGPLASPSGSTGQQWEEQHVRSTSWCLAQDV